MNARVDRRAVITLLGGAASAWPLAARAQQSERMRRIGVLVAATAGDPEYESRMAAFRQGLALSGWTDGRNVQVDTRWATTDAEQVRKQALELAALAPDVILAASGTTTVAPLLQATRTVPIVFVQSCSSWSLTRLAPASLQTWRVRVATPQAFSCSNTA
jgi:ABC-type uncharacterized transport system substrate-binding protein